MSNELTQSETEQLSRMLASHLLTPSTNGFSLREGTENISLKEMKAVLEKELDDLPSEMAEETKLTLDILDKISRKEFEETAQLIRSATTAPVEEWGDQFVF